MKLASGSRYLKGLVGLALATAVAATPVPAQSHHRRHHGPAPMGAGRTHLHQMFDQLDLTDAQRDEIRSLVMQHHEANQGRIEQLQQARLALFDRVHAETLDESAIRDAYAAVSASAADLSVARAALLQQIRRTLTPEQRAEASRLMEQHRARMAQDPGWMRGHGPRHGPGSFGDSPDDF